MELRGTHQTRGRPPGHALHPCGQGVGPLWLILSLIFFIYSKNNLCEVSGHSENFLFLHKNNTKTILLKTSSVRVSSIQIMQIRILNKGKRVWKSRYDGDVSTPLSLTHCLSSSNSVDKVKVIKKNFYKLCLLLLLYLCQASIQVFSKNHN